jgi:hypothetical protein
MAETPSGVDCSFVNVVIENVIVRVVLVFVPRLFRNAIALDIDSLSD